MYHKRHDENAYVAYIRGKRCKDIKSFLYEISAVLQFPDYFGENLAALAECICDLEWLNFEKIIIVVDIFDDVEPSTKDIFFDCMKEATKYWENENVSFNVIITGYTGSDI